MPSSSPVGFLTLLDFFYSVVERGSFDQGISFYEGKRGVDVVDDGPAGIVAGGKAACSRRYCCRWIGFDTITHHPFVLCGRVLAPDSMWNSSAPERYERHPPTLFFNCDP